MPLWLCNTDFKQFLACGNHRAQTRNLPAVFFVPLKICPRDSRRFALQDSFLSNWSTCTSRFRNEGRIYKRKKLNTDTKIKNQHIAYVLTPYCDLCTIQCIIANLMFCSMTCIDFYMYFTRTRKPTLY